MLRIAHTRRNKLKHTASPPPHTYVTHPGCETRAAPTSSPGGWRCQRLAAEDQRPGVRVTVGLPVSENGSKKSIECQ
eukprot:53778-Eustigmatos_ZCMA.PRE.1